MLLLLELSAAQLVVIAITSDSEMDMEVYLFTLVQPLPPTFWAVHVIQASLAFNYVVRDVEAGILCLYSSPQPL